MRKTLLVFATPLFVALPSLVLAQEYPPSCDRCASTHIPREEIEEFLEVESVDQQVRVVDIGKVNAAVAISHRGQLEEPGGVAEHSLVTEIYYVISGSGTNVTGPDLINSVPRPSSNRAVQRLNGPGHNAEGIRNGRTVELKAGDVFVIPAGTGHQFTRIDDHITYLMFRVDPDRMVPIMDEDDARRYLDNR